MFTLARRAMTLLVISFGLSAWFDVKKGEMDIVQLVYCPVEPQGASKDYEFSRTSMEKRWQQGISNARTVLHASPWLAPMPKELGVRVFDVASIVAAC